MNEHLMQRLRRRVQEVQARARVRQWEYRQRNLAAGVWFRLRRVLADARVAYAISDEEAGRLLDEGYVAEPCGREIAPAKTLIFVDATGPNMLSDVFADLLPEGKEVRAPTIWESSRFSVLQEANEHLAGQINPITGELLAGIVEVGIRAGLEFVVTVMDVAVERVLRRAGCPCDRIGSPRRIGKSLAVAGLFEMGTRC